VDIKGGKTPYSRLQELRTQRDIAMRKLRQAGGTVEHGVPDLAYADDPSRLPPPAGWDDTSVNPLKGAELDTVERQRAGAVLGNQLNERAVTPGPYTMELESGLDVEFSEARFPRLHSREWLDNLQKNIPPPEKIERIEMQGERFVAYNEDNEKVWEERMARNGSYPHYLTKE
jgi:hypothetical protein